TTENEPGPHPTPAPQPKDDDDEDERRKRVITVYRVESATSAHPRVTIGLFGIVAITGNDQNVLWLNFGQRARAIEYARRRALESKKDMMIKSFDVPVSFFEIIKSAAVDEREARKKEYRHRPIESRDPPRGTQFGLKEAQINLLRAVIIQGSGRQELYTP